MSTKTKLPPVPVEDQVGDAREHFMDLEQWEHDEMVHLLRYFPNDVRVVIWQYDGKYTATLSTNDGDFGPEVEYATEQEALEAAWDLFCELSVAIAVGLDIGQTVNLCSECSDCGRVTKCSQCGYEIE